jgi:hypothetical protein
VICMKRLLNNNKEDILPYLFFLRSALIKFSQYNFLVVVVFLMERDFRQRLSFFYSKLSPNQSRYLTDRRAVWISV